MYYQCDRSPFDISPPGNVLACASCRADLSAGQPTTNDTSNFLTSPDDAGAAVTSPNPTHSAMQR